MEKNIAWKKVRNKIEASGLTLKVCFNWGFLHLAHSNSMGPFNNLAHWIPKLVTLC